MTNWINRFMLMDLPSFYIVVNTW